MKKLWFWVMVYVATAPVWGQCDLKLPGARDASWAPNGESIVFSLKVKDGQQIFTMKSDGSNPLQLTDGDHKKYYPFYSPDGAKIVFMALVESISTIMIMDANGENLKQLTKTDFSCADPTWFPNGERIVFWSNRDGVNDIYSMKADGTDWQRITHDDFSNQTPSISPDGKRVLFVSDRDGNSELYYLELESGEISRLTQDPRSDRVPRWSGDGKKVVYYSREPTNVAGSGKLSWSGAELYELDLKEGTRTQLTHNLHLDQGPVYSPKGDQLLFTSCATGNREVFVMDLLTNEVRQLTHTQ